MGKIVILGLGSAGFAALLSARKFDPSTDITVIDEKPFDLLHVCGLPYALKGTVPFEKLRHDIGAERMGIKIVRGRATKIDAKKKKVIVDGKKEVGFDSLIIATGAKPIIPSIEGAKELLGKKVFTVHTLEDTMLLDKAAAKGRKAVVIGAGAVGLEVGTSLEERGLKVKIVEAMPNVMPAVLDPDMASIVEDYLKEKGIELLLGKMVEKITEKGVTVEGKEIDAELVVLAVSVKANFDLAKEAGVAIGENGISVNEYMQTNFRDIYAVGDVAEAPNLINGKKVVAGLANSAYLQGLLAGQNALGARNKYSGTSLTFVSVLGELEIASTGFNKAFAESSGIKVVEGRAKGKNKYRWFPGAADLVIKILVNKENRKIIGAQAVGKDALGRINAVSAAISAGMTIDDFCQLELAYCPPVSETYDILLVAADLAKRKLGRG